MDTSREQPWVLRRTSFEHEKWYSNLLEFHGITLGWLKELEVEHPAHFLGPSISPQIRSAMEHMTAVANHAVFARSLQDLLDDTAPEDLLARLETVIRTLQAWTLRSCLERSVPSEWPGILNLLEQSSWRSGRECAARRWGLSAHTEAPAAEKPRSLFRKKSAKEAALPPRSTDLREAFLMFQDHPLSGRPGKSTLLVKRAVATEIRAELLDCPHQWQSQGEAALSEPITTHLCALQFHFSRGMVSLLNPSAILEHFHGDGPSPEDSRGPTPSEHRARRAGPHRCEDRWRLA